MNIKDLRTQHGLVLGNKEQAVLVDRLVDGRLLFQMVEDCGGVSMWCRVLSERDVRRLWAWLTATKAMAAKAKTESA